LNKSGKWVEAESEDALNIQKAADQIMNIPNDKYNNLVGFMGYDNKNRFIVFKVRNMQSKRNTGARCEEAAKDKRIELLNEIIGTEKFTKKNEKDMTAEEKNNGVISTKGMVSTQMCSLQEFLLRYYNKIQKNGTFWFLDFELAMMHHF